MSFSCMIQAVRAINQERAAAAQSMRDQARNDDFPEYDSDAPAGWQSVETSVDDVQDDSDVIRQYDEELKSAAAAEMDNYEFPIGEPVAEPEEPIPQSARFQAPRKQLLEAIKTVGAACPRRTRYSATQKIWMSVNGVVRMQATDCEQSARIDLDYDRSGSAEILIDPARFAAALKLGKSVFVDVDINGDQVSIGQSTIPTDDPESFPLGGWETRADDVTHDFLIDAQRLAQAIARTEMATDSESTRYALAGILLEADSAAASLAATDSRRLSVCQLGEPEGYVGNGEPLSVVVPLATMSRVAKAIGKRSGDVRIIAHESIPVHDNSPRPGIDSDGKPTEEKHIPAPPAAALHVSFIVQTADGPLRFTTLPIAGRFPDYKRIIPQNFTHGACLRPARLLESCKLALSVRTDEVHGADFEFLEDCIRVSAQSEIGKISDSVVCDTTRGRGEPLTLTFDPEFLADFLKTVPADSWIEWRATKDGPAVLSADSDRFVYVAMPMSRDA